MPVCPVPSTRHPRPLLSQRTRAEIFRRLLDRQVELLSEGRNVSPLFEDQKDFFLPGPPDRQDLKSRLPGVDIRFHLLQDVGVGLAVFRFERFEVLLSLVPCASCTGSFALLWAKYYPSSLRPNPRLASPGIYGQTGLARSNTGSDTCVQYALPDQGP